MRLKCKFKTEQKFLISVLRELVYRRVFQGKLSHAQTSKGEQLLIYVCIPGITVKLMDLVKRRWGRTYMNDPK